MDEFERQNAGPLSEEIMSLQLTHRSDRIWKDPLYVDTKVRHARLGECLVER